MKQTTKRLKNQKFNSQQEGDADDNNKSYNSLQDIEDDFGIWSTQTTTDDFNNNNNNNNNNDDGDKSTEQNTANGIAYGNRGFGSFVGTGFGRIYEQPKIQTSSSSAAAAAAGVGATENNNKLNLLSNANSVLYR